MHTCICPSTHLRPHAYWFTHPSGHRGMHPPMYPPLFSPSPSLQVCILAVGYTVRRRDTDKPRKHPSGAPGWGIQTSDDRIEAGQVLGSSAHHLLSQGIYISCPFPNLPNDPKMDEVQTAEGSNGAVAWAGDTCCRGWLHTCAYATPPLLPLLLLPSPVLSAVTKGKMLDLALGSASSPPPSLYYFLAVRFGANHLTSPSLGVVI